MFAARKKKEKNRRKKNRKKKKKGKKREKKKKEEAGKRGKKETISALPTEHPSRLKRHDAKFCECWRKKIFLFFFSLFPIFFRGKDTT